MDDITLKDFQKKITRLRSTTTYNNDLDDIRNCLRLPINDEDSISIETLLIGVTKITLGTDTLETDMVLAALGLLKDYDNRHGSKEINEDDVRALLTERREKFLQESAYLENAQVNGKYYTYEDLKSDAATNKRGKSLLETALSTLGSKDGRYLIIVANKLYDNRSNLEEYIKASKKYLDLPELENKRTVPYSGGVAPRPRLIPRGRLIINARYFSEIVIKNHPIKASIIVIVVLLGSVLGLLTNINEPCRTFYGTQKIAGENLPKEISEGEPEKIEGQPFSIVSGSKKDEPVHSPEDW